MIGKEKVARDAWTKATRRQRKLMSGKSQPWHGNFNHSTTRVLWAYLYGLCFRRWSFTIANIFSFPRKRLLNCAKNCDRMCLRRDAQTVEAFHTFGWKAFDTFLIHTRVNRIGCRYLESVSNKILSKRKFSTAFCNALGLIRDIMYLFFDFSYRIFLPTKLKSSTPQFERCDIWLRS